MILMIGFLFSSILGVHELHFDEKCNNITLQDWLQHDLMSATLCSWMKTNSSGLHLKYKQETLCGERTSIQLVIEDTLLRTTLHGKTWLEDKF